MRFLLRLTRLILITGVCFGLLGIAAVGGAYWLVAPRLPSVDVLRDVQLEQPMRVYSRDGKLIGVFGEARRSPVDIQDVPLLVKQAFIAVEDARFYEHPGVDYQGVARAVYLTLRTGQKRVPGGSTITQQVAQNFFLRKDLSYTRKITEMFLALRMERELSKDEILELYLNKIFLGHRAYGVAAAADVYYGKTLDQLSLAEAAMLASLPKFPSTGNPISNPTRALERRNYVLDRMLDVGFIDAQQHALAIREPDLAYSHEPPVELDAPYVAEMVRLAARDLLGEDAMTGGYRVVTTLDSRLQAAANDAVSRALGEYDVRHGYRGPIAQHEIDDTSTTAQWEGHLSGLTPIAGMLAGIVTEVSDAHALVFLYDGQLAALDMASVEWARPYVSEDSRGPQPKRVDEVLRVGDVIRVARTAEGGWRLAQVPKVQGALVSMDPEDGAVLALVGGYNFARSKFNRATQSARQPGSSFKPFVYASAFERGFTPASIVLDAPIVYNDPSLERVWRPQNDNQKYNGPMRLREAMVTSRNTVSVRILRAVGVPYAREFMTRFGFPPGSLPENLSLALGTSSVPPLAMARAYSVLKNGGFLVEPHFIVEITNPRGETVFRANPERACRHCPERLLIEHDLLPPEPEAALPSDVDLVLSGMEPVPAPGSGVDAAATQPEVRLAPRAIDERNAFLISSLLRDVVKRGTGRGALVLERDDLGGKTGTTNDFRDAWFSGFGPGVVTTAWVGFDDFTPLGKGEFASKAALPMWVDYMRVALLDRPAEALEIPPGITTARIDRKSGRIAAPGRTEGTLLEVFREEDLERLSQDAPQPGEGETPPDYDIF